MEGQHSAVCVSYDIHVHVTWIFQQTHPSGEADEELKPPPPSIGYLLLVALID